MAELQERSRYNDADFDAVHNRNETLVRSELKKMLEEEDFYLSPKDIQDVYALTLNDFPPHYVHKGTIVLVPNIRRPDILNQLRRNVLFVQSKPKV